jgi:hypothetical protein
MERAGRNRQQGSQRRIHHSDEDERNETDAESDVDLSEKVTFLEEGYLLFLDIGKMIDRPINGL